MTDWDETTSVALAPEPERERPERDRAYLIVLAGSGVGEMHKLGGESVLGRGREAQLRFLDDGISRMHCRVYRDGDRLVVEDCGSRNGTFCNGESIAGPHELRDGDKIQIGRTTILKFTYHDHLDESFQRQMYDSALRDSLTKAYNKRYFDERLSSEFRFSHRHGETLSLLLLDLDHFKPINDQLGHLAGDHALVELARRVQRIIRNEDVFARYGGEEFAIISRAIPSQQALRFGERVRAEIESMEVRYRGHAIPLTASVGVATFPHPHIERAGQLVEAADRALYAAKNAGRNTVRSWNRK